MYVTIGQRTIEGHHRWNTAQDLAVISGKVIRLKDDGSVPKDNPFVDTAGALPEIYTLGHRMPEGLVYDRHTGKLWENEHGENGGCELNLLGPGKNYGWPKTTFSINYNGTIITTDTVLPVWSCLLTTGTRLLLRQEWISYMAIVTPAGTGT